MNENRWISHVEFFVLLITLLGSFYLLDGKIERGIQVQSARSDRLYEMFIDMVRVIKK
jgi:hypothetical protein